MEGSVIMAEAKFGKMGAQLKHGYNSATICESNMMMDIGIQVMSAGEKLTFNEQAKEVAYVILTGEVKISWENNTEVMKRTSLFDENPSCLHVPLATEVTIEAVVDSEVLIQKTENDTKFAPKFYHPEDVQADVSVEVYGAVQQQGLFVQFLIMKMRHILIW